MKPVWINPDPKHPEDWFSLFEREGWQKYVPAPAVPAEPGAWVPPAYFDKPTHGFVISPTKIAPGLVPLYAAQPKAEPLPIPDWTRVEDGLPPDREFVLLCCPSGYTTCDLVYITGRRDVVYRGEAWITHSNDRLGDWGLEPTHWAPLPRAPQAQPAAQPLTDDAIAELWSPHPGGDVRRPIMGRNKVLAFARAVERAHGIKGDAQPLTRSQKMTEAGFTRRPSLWAMEAREALELIAAPMRPDGTWNRDREACRVLAAEVLGKGEEA